MNAEHVRLRGAGLKTNELLRMLQSENTHHTHTQGTQCSERGGGGLNRKAAQRSRQQRNVRLHQLIRFIFTWLRGRLSRAQQASGFNGFLAAVLLKK